jgi:hypothetical protein
MSDCSVVGRHRDFDSAGGFDQPVEIVDGFQRHELRLAEFTGEPAFEVMDNLHHAH